MSQPEGSVPTGPGSGSGADPTVDPAGGAPRVADGPAGDDGHPAEGEVVEGEVVDEPLGADGAAGAGFGDADSDVAEAVELAKRFEAQKNEYLEHAQRLQAEFENFRRRTESQAADQRAQAAIGLVRDLLPVLDACDAALSHGHDQVEPIRSQLVGILEGQGLQTVSEEGVPFDPNIHEAVMHEAADGDPVVAEVMRTGYLWKDRVVRAAMVKVRG